MSHWLPQADGSILGSATPRAEEWAQGNAEKLAAIGFVAFCRDMQLDPFWASDDWDTLGVNPNWAITVRRCYSPDHDKFHIHPEETASTYAVIRVMKGKPPTLHILGVTSIYDQLEATHGPLIPRRHLLSCLEWLRAFPVHHTPYTEADHHEQTRQARQPHGRSSRRAAA